MVRTLTATELKAKVLGLLDDVASGDEIVITKRGVAVARLVPIADGASLRGRLAGKARTAVDDEEELFSTSTDWEAS